MNSTNSIFNTARKILDNCPSDWLELTTHRLDVYDENQAKSQFLQHLEGLQAEGGFSVESLQALPTAYDYIRLGHPLSSVLEWLIGQVNQLPSEQVITFASKTMPLLAVLRKNTLTGTATAIYYDTDSSPLIDQQRLQDTYGYGVELHHVDDASKVPDRGETTVIFVTESAYKKPLTLNQNIDVIVNTHSHYGSAVLVDTADAAELVKDIQHVRRRESIAMTPIGAFNVLQEMANDTQAELEVCTQQNLDTVYECIKQNTGASVTPLIASSGLCIQYAMMMGLIEEAMIEHAHKPIKLIIPPNCYGGTNDQARRIADLIESVEVVDLLVDRGQELVSSLDAVLNDVAKNDCVPIILAEIPTNPRVEVPDMTQLAAVLMAKRNTEQNTDAAKPIFTVDQTFCPNVPLLHEQSELAGVKTVSYSSGSKFPSGGRCIAGFCTTNNAAKLSQPLIKKHLVLSDNAATPHQLNTLAAQLPSMPARIKNAYNNTRTFVDHIQGVLPAAKINFIPHDLAERGFTPSVFSLDLPSTGGTDEERENHKKQLNLKLIEHMVHQYPNECKHCVSYGQLKGSYWTIPATSTQGTTQESDKDYIVRIALSAEVAIEKLAACFDAFCKKERLI